MVAVDLPCEDERAGLAEYTDAVEGAIGDRTGLILVAQSLGAFVAPLVFARLPVELLVLVAGIVPRPGERGEDWLANTGYPRALADDEIEVFYSGVPRQVVERARAQPRADQAVGREPWPLERWPDVPTRYLLCRDDRLLPARWLRGVVRERLGVVPDEIESGHCPALGCPRHLAERLEAYRWALVDSSG